MVEADLHDVLPTVFKPEAQAALRELAKKKYSELGAILSRAFAARSLPARRR